LKTAASQVDGYQQTIECDGLDPDYGPDYFEFRGDVLRVTGRVFGTIDRLSTSLCDGVLSSSLTDPDSERSADQGMTYLDIGDIMPFDVRVSDRVEMDDVMRELHPDLLHWLNTNRKFIGSRPLRESFEPLEPSKRIRGAFETWYDAEKGLLNSEPDCKQLDKAMNLVDQVLKCGTRLFVTTDGHFGMAHAQAQKEDNIFLIRGCSMPVILRRRGDYWNVIGEAYLHRCPEPAVRGEDIQLR
jgi:hypothetical protein